MLCNPRFSQLFMSSFELNQRLKEEKVSPSFVWARYGWMDGWMYICMMFHVSIRMLSKIYGESICAYLVCCGPACLLSFIHLCRHPFIQPSVDLSLYPTNQNPIHLPIHPSTYPSIHPSLYLSIYLPDVQRRRPSHLVQSSHCSVLH